MTARKFCRIKQIIWVNGWRGKNEQRNKIYE